MSLLPPMVSEELRLIVGISSEDVEKADDPRVKTRLRQSVWRYLQERAFLLVLINEFKRQVRPSARHGDRRRFVKCDRQRVVDAMFDLVCAVSGQLYQEWMTVRNLADAHPTFIVLLPRYSDTLRLCDEPGEYLTQGDYCRACPQFGPFDTPPYQIIEGVINEDRTNDPVTLLDHCLAAWWKNLSYDDIIVRAREFARTKSA